MGRAVIKCHKRGKEFNAKIVEEFTAFADGDGGGEMRIFRDTCPRRGEENHVKVKVQ